MSREPDGCYIRGWGCAMLVAYTAAAFFAGWSVAALLEMVL